MYKIYLYCSIINLKNVSCNNFLKQDFTLNACKLPVLEQRKSLKYRFNTFPFAPTGNSCLALFSLAYFTGDKPLKASCGLP